MTHWKWNIVVDSTYREVPGRGAVSEVRSLPGQEAGVAVVGV